MIESYGVSHPGLVRTTNQDRILIDHSLQVFAIADGMGGHQHGEVAAELALTTMKHYLEVSRDPLEVSWPFGYQFDLSIDANRLSTSTRLANRQIWRRAEQSLECSGMGTTIAVIMLGDTGAAIANVGDSRVYQFRDGLLMQLSVDDTWISTLAASGSVPLEDLANHPMRNILTQAAGSQEALEVHLTEIQLGDGDIYLLTSDGVHGVLGDDRLASILQMPGLSLQQTGDLIMEIALRAGAPDNASIVLLGYTS